MKSSFHLQFNGTVRLFPQQMDTRWENEDNSEHCRNKLLDDKIIAGVDCTLTSKSLHRDSLSGRERFNPIKE